MDPYEGWLFINLVKKFPYDRRTCYLNAVVKFQCNILFSFVFGRHTLKQT